MGNSCFPTADLGPLKDWKRGNAQARATEIVLEQTAVLCKDWAAG